MNIAFVTTEYITELEFDGGLANYLYRVTQALVSRGHHVEMFTLSDQDDEIYHQDVLVHRVQNGSIVFDLLNRFTRYRFKRTIRFLSLSYCLNKRLLERHLSQHFDIIQASSCFACGLFSTFASRLPVVARVSSFEPLFRKYYRRKLNLDQRICEWLELLAIRRSNAVYCPSKFLSEVLGRQLEKQVDVLRPPFLLETEDFDESVHRKHLSGKKYILFFGAIGFLKGCEVIALCLPELLNRFQDMHFVFVGKNLEGPRSLSMMDFIFQQAGGSMDRVHYLGILRPPELYPIIKNSHAVVLPSLIDNLPNTMLEAMFFGKVVIGTRGTSFEELIVHQVSGILVEPNDPEELYTALETVWKMSEEERESIGHEAQARLAFLSPQKTCCELEEYYQRVVNRR